jgi:hypothetical protein
MGRLPPAPQTDVSLSSVAQGYEFDGFAHLPIRIYLFMFEQFRVSECFSRDVIQIEIEHRIAAELQVREFRHRDVASFQERTIKGHPEIGAEERCRPDGEQHGIEFDPVFALERLGHESILCPELR